MKTPTITEDTAHHVPRTMPDGETRYARVAPEEAAQLEVDNKWISMKIEADYDDMLAASSVYARITSILGRSTGAKVEVRMRIHLDELSEADYERIQAASELAYAAQFTNGHVSHVYYKEPAPTKSS